MKALLPKSLLALGLLLIPGYAKAELAIGLQAWTFRQLTLFETVDKAAALGVTSIEAFPGQKLGGELTGKMGPGMTEDERRETLAKFRSAGVTLCSIGVINAPDEKAWREIFVFAKAMGLQWITTEPPLAQLPLLDGLSREYGVPLAIHNHGPPSPYADPANTRLALDKCSSNIGVCADTGHWARAGHDPAKALALFPGRIVALHLKDVAEWKQGARDVPYGQGVSDVPAMLAELRKQDFRGMTSIEYEHGSPRLDEEVSRCIAYLKHPPG